MTHEAHLVYEAAVSPQNRSETLDNPLHFVRLLTFLTGVNVGNLLLATALLAPWRWFKSLTCAYPALAVFGTAAIWLATWRDSTGFLIGWWFWLASSYVLAVLVRPPWYALVPATMLWALMWYK